MRRHGVAVLVLLVAGCSGGGGSGRPGTVAGGTGSATVVWSDVTEEAGLHFVHTNGASPERLLPETMGSGVAFFDYDGDGFADLYFVNSRSLTDPEAPAAGGALYRNLGDGRFADVTAAAGLGAPFFGMGAAVGDIDNDGDLDLFVTGVGGDRFYRNRGDGRFEEVAATLGLAQPGFGSSAAFVDYDRDGFLDLFVGRYVTWSRQTDVPCSPDGEHRSYCTPEVYPGAADRLYRNVGGGRFEEVTAAAGVERPDGKTLGVVAFDHDGDGWPDLAVANDTVRNYLFVNQRNGTFREVAVESGLAYSVSGATRGGMGIDAGDLDGDGRADLVVGNFSQEMSALYRAAGSGLYTDEAAQLGVGIPTLMTLAFGTLALDADSDGRLDVLFANGHIEPEIARFQPLQRYAQPLQLFLNRGPGFELLTGEAGTPLGTPWVGRGLAAADYDRDGDLDLVLTQNGGPARLFRNDSRRRSFLRVELVGTKSNRTAYGATVTVVAGERRIRRELSSGRSYLSASEPVLTIGLGEIEVVDRLEVRWPSGETQTIERPQVGGVVRVVEEGS